MFYRQVYIKKTTNRSVGLLIKNLITCNGDIVAIGTLLKSSPMYDLAYRSKLYTVRFHNIENLESFMSFGWQVVEDFDPLNNIMVTENNG